MSSGEAAGSCVKVGVSSTSSGIADWRSGRIDGLGDGEGESVKMSLVKELAGLTADTIAAAGILLIVNDDGVLTLRMLDM